MLKPPSVQLAKQETASSLQDQCRRSIWVNICWNAIYPVTRSCWERLPAEPKCPGRLKWVLLWQQKTNFVHRLIILQGIALFLLNPALPFMELWSKRCMYASNKALLKILLNFDILQIWKWQSYTGPIYKAFCSSSIIPAWYNIWMATGTLAIWDSRQNCLDYWFQTCASFAHEKHLITRHSTTSAIIGCLIQEDWHRLWILISISIYINIHVLRVTRGAYR